MSAIMEKNIPAGASEILLKTAGKYCDKDIRVTSPSHFRMESGALRVDSDQKGTSGQYSLKIPCANGAKLFFIQADNTEIVDTVNNRTTYNVIIKGTTENDGNGWFVGAFGQMLKKDIGTKTDRAHMYNMKVLSTNKWQPGETGTSCTNTDGISITTLGVKAGKYNWTAYYWDE